jgi:4-hydroxyphenylpyruvate dioxygenase-like putative hemolysin
MRGDALPRHGRVSHVVFCVQPDQLDEAVAFWSIGLGITFDRVEIEGSGLHIEFAEAAGIEVITPTDSEAGKRSIAQKYLDDHGEGVFAVVYRVPDLDGATAAVSQVGVNVIRRISLTGRAPWSERYDAFEEVHLSPLHGMRVALGRMNYKD